MSNRDALRWPWGRGSGEAQLGLGSGGREGWGLGQLGVRLTEMLKDQAESLGVPQEGPCKPDRCRY